MNVPAQDTHPSSEMLTAFAHGHLEDPDAFAVAEHLDICATCQQAVLAVPEDSMMALLRPAASTPVQRPEAAGATTLAFTEGVPPEVGGKDIGVAADDPGLSRSPPIRYGRARRAG